MRRRLTARVLLLDAAGRILLMKARPREPLVGGWFPIGGGAEPGESLLQAAAREIVEESGIAAFELGPVVWRRQGEFVLHDGERVWMDEHYLVARCAGGEAVRDGWAAHELELVEDMRWWTEAELLATAERVFPAILPARLGDLIAGRYPPAPIEISWR